MHSELRQLRKQLSEVYDAVDNFRPLIPTPPIIDSSISKTDEPGEENQWLQQGIDIPGLRKLKDDIKVDLSILDKFLDDPNCVNLPPITTNAPYIISVWNELLFAQQPILSVLKTFLFNPHVSMDNKKKYSKTRALPPGAKVDVVADNGRRWIRVNTIKNSRLLAEFREIDSYLTDSGDDSDDNIQRPTLAQTEFDNSILQMGRSLLKAAKVNPIEGTNEIPAVTLHLTRLNPDLSKENPKGNVDEETLPDPRIRQTVDLLREMGIDVVLGERTADELRIKSSLLSSSPRPIPQLRPTNDINLDLSTLIALISDLSHAPLPRSIEEANKRFVPPPEYREWKQQRRLAMMGKSTSKSDGGESSSTASQPTVQSGMENDINDLPRDLIRHARELTNKLLQEMNRELLEEIHSRITNNDDNNYNKDPSTSIRFWVTPEARERCLRIVLKIGGAQEKRRVRALFQLSSNALDFSSTTQLLDLSEAERLFWQDSRFPLNFIPLLPLHILPDSSIDNAKVANLPGRQSKSTFAFELAKVCADLIAQETTAPADVDGDATPPATENIISTSPTASAMATTTTTTTVPELSYNSLLPEELHRARFLKASPRLSAHTVQTMRWGAELGWTILTANRTSVKAIVKEMGVARVAGRLTGSGGGGDGGDVEQDGLKDRCDEKDGLMNKEINVVENAALWIVGPRSLAEGMSSLQLIRAS